MKKPLIRSTKPLKDILNRDVITIDLEHLFQKLHIL